MSSAVPSASPTQLAPVTAHHHNPYGYVPTEWVCILFIALFAVSTSEYRTSTHEMHIAHICMLLVMHSAQAIRSRLWWLLPTVFVAGIGEILGWSARLWSSQNVYLSDPFIMQ